MGGTYGQKEARLLQERAPGTFAVTPVGVLLHPDAPGSVASFVRMFTGPALIGAWEHLDESVRTGEVAFDTVFGTDFFSHPGQHPQPPAEFDAAMSQAVAGTAAALPHAFDFGRFSHLTDVGGGRRNPLARVPAAHPHLAGAVFDTAEGLARAPETLGRHGLGGRRTPVARDFFRSVPQGSDLHLGKSVLHDCPAERAVTILRHCRPALPPGGIVLIVEPVLPETVRAAGAGTYLSDLNMLVNLGGRERTREEFAELCRRAGLALTSVTPLAEATPYSLIEAVAG